MNVSPKRDHFKRKMYSIFQPSIFRGYYLPTINFQGILSSNHQFSGDIIFQPSIFRGYYLPTINFQGILSSNHQFSGDMSVFYVVLIWVLRGNHSKNSSSAREISHIFTSQKPEKKPSTKKTRWSEGPATMTWLAGTRGACTKNDDITIKEWLVISHLMVEPVVTCRWFMFWCLSTWNDILETRKASWLLGMPRTVNHQNDQE